MLDICEAFNRRLLEGPKAFSLDDAANEGDEPSTTDNGIRVIPVRGVMSKRMNMFSAFSGGVSTEILADQIKEAVADDSVKGVFLDIDSPGGSVDGSFTLADAVFEARGAKPIVAFADGMAASAAFLLASAAGTIVANRTATVGSIGVISTHVDRTAATEAAGLKVTVLHSGKFKAAGSPDVSLDRQSTAYIQSRLDEFYGMFVESVARNRGMDASSVASTEARVFIGESAKANGLVDVIGEREDALALLSSIINTNQRGQGFAPRGEENGMTIKEAMQAVLEGNADSIENATDRETAEDLVALCREHLRAESDAAETVATDTEDVAEILDSTPSIQEEIDAEEAHALAIRTCVQGLGLSAEYGNSLVDKGISIEAATKVALTEAERRQAPLDADTEQVEPPKAADPTNKDLHEKALAYAKENGCDYREALRALT
jgi:signal peptide peptidase SppA